MAVLALLGFHATAAAEVKLSIADFVIAPGETKTVEILMENDETNVTDLQFDLTLPANLTYVEGSAAKTDRLNANQSLTVVKQAGGAYRFLFLSSTRDGFSGTSGAIATFQVTASDVEGDYEISFSGFKAVAADASTPVTPAPEPADVVIEAPFEGVAFSTDVTSLTLAPGEEAEIPIVLRNSMNLVSLQGDVTLPAGLEFVYDETDPAKSFVTLSERAAAHAATCKPENGRFVVTSAANAAFTGERGTIVTIKVRATATLPATATITIGGFVVSNPSAIATIVTDQLTVNVTNSSTPATTYTVTATVTPAEAGTVEGAGDYADGENATLTATPAEGYTFTGWYVSGASVSTDASYTFPVTADITVEARFVEATVPTYVLTFVVDGETYSTENLAEGAAITAPTPEKTGYTFSGWTPAVAATMPAEDVTYTGSFAVNSYVVTFVIDGQTVSQQTLPFGAAITAPDVTAPDGYYFSGWQPAVAATVPAADVTYTGSYVRNGEYTVTFIDQGQVIMMFSLPQGAELTPPAVPGREGYSFAGWTPAVPATMPARALVFNASYTPNKYLVSYYVGTLLYAEEEVTFGSPVTLIAYTDPEGRYTLVEWQGDTYETMPAHNIEYRALLADGVSAITTADAAADAAAYTIDGRRVSTKALAPGIYVIAGRKVVVR